MQRCRVANPIQGPQIGSACRDDCTPVAKRRRRPPLLGDTMPSANDVHDDQTITYRASAGEMRRLPQDEPVHLLLLLDDNAPAKRMPLRRLPLTIGRAAPADLILPGGTVSRRHCLLDLREGRLLISDLGSTNGTFVDDVPVEAATVLHDGATIAIGAHRLRYHRRRLDETAEADAMDRELQEASNYVASILPPPIETGPVETDWFYRPCTRLAGDAFGYQMVDRHHFAVFLLDVAGHGTGAALHAVSVANVLRQRLLPDADVRDPAAVIRSLNRMFPMQQYNGLFFTIWYGVYNTAERVLTYAAGGHHPGYLLVPRAGLPVALSAPNPTIGMMPDCRMVAARTSVPAGSTLYLFSDGVCEIVDRDGHQWGLNQILPLLSDVSRRGGPRLLYERVRQMARPGPLEDDFSALLLHFP